MCTGQRPHLQLDTLLSTSENSAQSSLCTQRGRQRDSPTSWMLQVFITASPIVFNLRLGKQRSLSHHNAQPGCMCHMTSPRRAGTRAAHWADTAVGLPTCLKNLSAGDWSSAAVVWFFPVHVDGSATCSGHGGSRTNCHSACDIWWCWRPKMSKSCAFCGIMLSFLQSCEMRENQIMTVCVTFRHSGEKKAGFQSGNTVSNTDGDRMWC